MYYHAPEGYICPFCLVVAGVENEHVLTRQADIVYRDERVTAFISAGFWTNNKGHVLIIPNAHYENLYDLPSAESHAVHDLEKEVALALKAVYHCDGVSTRQHNEPAGDQDVWHYHVHVFPRYAGDNLHQAQRQLSWPEERLIYAEKLKAYFAKL